MRTVVTGARGTVGRALCRHLHDLGHQVVRWNRDRVPIDDYGAMHGWLSRTAPDAVFHLAIASEPTGRADEAHVVNVHWVHELAWALRQLGIPWVFTSTAMVFRDDHDGPHRVDTVPSATECYGGQKAEAEAVARRQDPSVRIARLGWQIGEDDVGNQMVAWLHGHHGPIHARTDWKPATSFLDDTAAALVGLLSQPPGTYHVDGNDQGWSFHQIVEALRHRHGADWEVLPTDGPGWDQRLVEHHAPCRSISLRLDGL